MIIMNHSNDIFTHKNSGIRYYVKRVYSTGDGVIIQVQRLGNFLDTYEYSLQEFMNEFVVEKENVAEELKPIEGVNNDILILIESGYTFKSFFGTTTDGRIITIDV